MESQRILVVDDDSLNRFLLMHMLEEQGYSDCYEASSGHEALELAERVKPDLILLDIVMPGMDGFEVAERLKKDAESYLPIIFITASDDRENLVKCLEVGGDDFAIKPFDKSILAAKIRAHLRIRSMAQHIEAQNAELSTFQQYVETEHAMVEHIYSHALQNPPETEQFFDVVLNPATTFNGDLFLAQPHPSGGVYFLLGDFTGHGLASTIGAIPVSRTFSGMCSQGRSLVEIAGALNELLHTTLPIERFFSATIGHVNDDGTRANIWQGGMPDMFVQQHYDKSVVPISAKHMALGILSPAEFESDCTIVELEHGDTLYLFTDGVTEATPNDSFSQADQHDMLGETTLRQWIADAPGIGSQAILDKVCNTLNRTQFDDDVTLVKFVSQDLSSLKNEEAFAQLPFTLSVSLGPEELRKENSVEQILQVLNSQQGLSSVRSDIFTILSEMYTNALEHGLLNLDSDLKDTPEGFMEYYDIREAALEALNDGFIRVEINLYPSERRVSVAVTDSGDGFDHQQMKQSSDNASSGRGLQLLNEICDALWFEGNGNRIVVELSV